MLEIIVGKGGYWVIIALMMTGLYIVFAATNLIKRMVGLSIFQTSVFLFYITLAKVAGGTAPVLYGRDYPKTYPADDKPGAAYGAEGSDGSDAAPAPGEGLGPDAPGSGLEPTAIQTAGSAYGGGEYGGVIEVYSNPLPHVLILTAIVVGVATLAVGLAIIVRIREAYGTIEADEIREMDIIVATAEEAEDRTEIEPKDALVVETPGSETKGGAPA